VRRTVSRVRIVFILNLIRGLFCMYRVSPSPGLVCGRVLVLSIRLYRRLPLLLRLGFLCHTCGHTPPFSSDSGLVQLIFYCSRRVSGLGEGLHSGSSISCCSFEGKFLFCGCDTPSALSVSFANGPGPCNCMRPSTVPRFLRRVQVPQSVVGLLV